MSRLNSSEIRERLSTRKGKLATRFIFLIVVAFVFAKVAPTLADENSPGPELATPTISASPDAASSASPSPIPSDSTSAEPTPTPVLSPVPSDPKSAEPAPVPTTSSSPSPSASPTPSVLALARQNIKINVPAKLNVDPRANTIYFPSINISSPEHLLVCISSSDLYLDVYLRSHIDSNFGTAQLVAMDQSHNVMITGTSAQVAAIINGAGGFAAFNPLKPVQGSKVQIQAVALSMPSLNPSFCSQGSPKNTATTFLTPLGITLDFKKGDIPLKR